MPVTYKGEPETPNVRENAFLRGRRYATCSGDPAQRLAAKASAFTHEAPVRAERIFRWVRFGEKCGSPFVHLWLRLGTFGIEFPVFNSSPIIHLPLISAQ